MAASLKSIIPRLSRSLGMTPAAIYERQRALVRCGLLQARPGRGPGSGVPADAKSLAMLLISVLAAGSLSEVETQTNTIANFKPLEGMCKATGERTFGAALTAVLKSKKLLARTLVVNATRSGTRGTARITIMSIPVDQAIGEGVMDAVVKYASHIYFGDAPYELHEDNWALDVEATLNIRSALRGIEIGDSK